MKMVSFRMPDHLVTRLAKVAAAEGNQVSSVVRRLVTLGLPDVERTLAISSPADRSEPERVKRRA